MNRMEGKVACVTGAASGIGRASAGLFLRDGAHVVVADIDEARGDALAREWPGRARFMRVGAGQSPTSMRRNDWSG